MPLLNKNRIEVPAQFPNKDLVLVECSAQQKPAVDVYEDEQFRGKRNKKDNRNEKSNRRRR